MPRMRTNGHQFALERMHDDNHVRGAERRQRFMALVTRHLRDTGNPAVGFGDSGLLHEIAAKAGIKANGYKTEKTVLDKIDRSNAGEMVKKYWNYRGRAVRVFRLPE